MPKMYLALSRINSNIKIQFYLMNFSSIRSVSFVLEGMAVGVGFGAIGKTPAATFQNARLK